MCFRMDCALAPVREVVPMAFLFADDVDGIALDCALRAQGEMLLDSAIPSTVGTATAPQRSCGGV